MAIIIRKIKGVAVAVCAAKTMVEDGDVYLEDNIHHALKVKFAVDFESEGLLKNPPIDKKVKKLMLEIEK